MKALVVGGTGPTGPYIVNGLLERGYDVAIFHRGSHEIDEIPPEVEHIHGDPHFLETIEESLHGRTFDLAVVTYGRIRFLAQALAGKVERFISVGGVASYRGYLEPERLSPPGLLSPVGENAALVADESEHRFSYLIAQTERTVLEYHPRAAHFRYPYVYGPRQLIPREWCIMRRLLDGREKIIVADGGLNICTRGFVENLAQTVLLAVDKPSESAGQIYNCGDEQQLNVRQQIESIAKIMEREIEFVNMPYDLAIPARAYSNEPSPHHRIMDISKIRTQLEYRDLRTVDDALRITIEWLLDHRPERGGEVEQRLQDPFNYAGEDALIAAFEDAASVVTEVPFDLVEDKPHPYAHPKKPGERDHRNR